MYVGAVYESSICGEQTTHAYLALANDPEGGIGRRSNC